MGPIPFWERVCHQLWVGSVLGEGLSREESNWVGSVSGGLSRAGSNCQRSGSKVTWHCVCTLSQLDTHIYSVSPPTTPPAMRRATRRATASFVHGITRSQLRYCFVGFP